VRGAPPAAETRGEDAVWSADELLAVEDLSPGGAPSASADLIRSAFAARCYSHLDRLGQAAHVSGCQCCRPSRTASGVSPGVAAQGGVATGQLRPGGALDQGADGGAGHIPVTPTPCCPSSRLGTGRHRRPLVATAASATRLCQVRGGSRDADDDPDGSARRYRTFSPGAGSAPAWGAVERQNLP